MGQPPQPPSVGTEQPYYFIPNMQSFDPSREAEWQSQPWMMATIIEDDDLTFGGKPLSTWYEEDRRRCSFGDEEGSENGSPAEFAEEEERRGRQRDRPQYEKVSHSHHKHHHHPHHHHNHHNHHRTTHKSKSGEQKH